jgi:hypothetical protein
MGTTPTLLLPYPEPADPADVPADMNELATRIEAVRGAANGLASLDSGGKIPAAQLPAVAGAELGYAQITADVAVPTSGVTAVVSAGAITFAAAPIIIEFWATGVLCGAGAGSTVSLDLYADGSQLGQIGQLNNNAAAALLVTVHGVRRITPAAGSHTYDIRARAVGAAATIGAGGGGSGQFAPAFIRITRAN